MADTLQESGAHQFGGVLIEPGYSFSQSVLLTEDEIRRFASLCGDTNPVHHDVGFASTTRYQTIIACGPHTLALFTGLAGTHFSSITPMVGLEFSYKFRRAVRANDTLEMTWRVVKLAEKRSLGGYLVHLAGEAINQHGEQAVTGSGVVLLTEQL